MIRLNNQCYVDPDAIIAVSVDDSFSKVTALVAEIGQLEVQRDYGEGVWDCAARINKAIREARQGPSLHQALLDLGLAIEGLKAELAKSR